MSTRYLPVQRWWQTPAHVGGGVGGGGGAWPQSVCLRVFFIFMSLLIATWMRGILPED